MADLYIREGSRALGPYAEDALRLRCAGAELADTTMSWREGERRWISLRRRWARNRYSGIRATASWMSSVAFAAIALIVSTQLIDLPRALRSFPVSTTVAVVATALSLLIAYWHWRSVSRTNGRPTLGSVLCALVAGLAAICALSGIGTQKRISDNRASLQDASMVFDAATGELRIDGYIADRFVDDLRTALDRAPGIKRITIDSLGGFVDDALEAGRLLGQRGITVRVLNECASACTVFWSSAPRREMRFGARLGLHQSTFGVELPSLWRKNANDQLEAQTSTILKLAGFNDEILKNQAITPASDMYWVDAVELFESGVQLTIVDAQGTRLTGSHAKLMSVATDLEESPFRKLLEAYGTRAPQFADKFGPDLYAAWHAQDADGIFQTTHHMSAAAKAYAVANAPDGALIDWARRMRGILAGTIAESDTASCSVILAGAHAGNLANPTSGKLVLALAELVEAVPEAKGTDPSSMPKGNTARTYALIGRVFREKVRQGFPARYDQWSPLQRCKFMDGVYGAILQMPPSEAASAIRIAESG